MQALFTTFQEIEQMTHANHVSAGVVGQTADPLRGVNVVVERAERNSRRLYAAVQIAAPVETVWGALTDYEGLSNFIPGMSLGPYNLCVATSRACSGTAMQLQLNHCSLAMQRR